AGGSEPATVRSVGQAANCAGMSFKGGKRLATDNVPKPDNPVETARSDLAAVGTEDDTVNRTNMPFERSDLPTILRLPEGEGAAVLSRDDLRSVRAEGY